MFLLHWRQFAAHLFTHSLFAPLLSQQGMKSYELCPPRIIRLMFVYISVSVSEPCMFHSSLVFLPDVVIWVTAARLWMSDSGFSSSCSEFGTGTFKTGGSLVEICWADQSERHSSQDGKPADVNSNQGLCWKKEKVQFDFPWINKG